MNFSVPMPQRIAKLPVDKRGYPVPWFVAKDERGEFDFRVMDGEKLYRAVRERRCWVCGEKLGRYLAFTIGPMCAINRTSGEPPGHRECSEFSAQACPFLSNPDQKRNPKQFHGEVEGPGGYLIPRNPAVAMTWVCEGYTVQMTETGPIFKIEEPTEVIFFTHGRKAFQHEVFESIESGYPILYDMAEKEGRIAVDLLLSLKARAYDIVRTYAKAADPAAIA